MLYLTSSANLSTWQRHEGALGTEIILIHENELTVFYRQCQQHLWLFNVAVP